MRRVFADTFYWIDLLNPKDQGYHEALSISKDLGASRITTTDEVLTGSSISLPLAGLFLGLCPR